MITSLCLLAWLVAPSAGFRAAPHVRPALAPRQRVRAFSSPGAPEPSEPIVPGDGEGLSGDISLPEDGLASVDLKSELGDSFMQYAMSIILGRALPDARDGLKPVHRRILFAMHALNLQPEGPHRKCARVVGEVLGKFHPHGDGAVYEALVRMTQDWVMSAPLINGHGNFGSLDADPPAAMRYTECKLAPLARDALLADIGQSTVDFAANFDGSEQEPLVLPSRLPLLLVNGASGIAVGMATNIPPHNLLEIIDALVLLARDPAATDEALFAAVPAPDFPTGGFVLGTKGARDLYTAGRGSIQMRAKTHVEALTRGGDRKSVRSAIIVSELPYMVNKAAFLEKTAALVNDKKLDGVADLRDESDRDGVRVVIELKRDANPSVVQNNLFKRTQLQVSFGANLVALTSGGKAPQRLSLRAALDEFIAFRFDTVRRRTAHDLDKLRRRKHIVDGLLVALSRVDAVVDTVRAAKDTGAAREALMASEGGFGLSREQADAILNLRLARLTALESGKLEAEAEELLEGIGGLETLMEDDDAVVDVMVREWRSIGDRYGVPRRSTIVTDPRAAMELSEEDLLANDRSVVVLTRAGYIKRMPLDQFDAQRRGTRGKSGARLRGEEAEEERDQVTQFFTCNDHDTVLFVTQRGVAHAVRAFQVPLASRTARGAPLPSVLPLEGDDGVAGVVPVTAGMLDDEDQFLVLITRRGWIKKTRLSAFASTSARGLIVLGLEDGDRLLRVRRCSSADSVVVSTRRGFASRFEADQAQLRATGRTARGVKSIKLRDGDEIADLDVLPRDTGDQTSLLAITERGYGKRISAQEFRSQKRGGMGVVAIKFKSEDDSLKCCTSVGKEDEVMFTTQKGTIVRQSAAAIPAQGRQATGVRVQRLDDGDAIVEVCVVPEEDAALDDLSEAEPGAAAAAGAAAQ